MGESPTSTSGSLENLIHCYSTQNAPLDHPLTHPFPEHAASLPHQHLSTTPLQSRISLLTLGHRQRFLSHAQLPSSRPVAASDSSLLTPRRRPILPPSRRPPPHALLPPPSSRPAALPPPRAWPHPLLTPSRRPRISLLTCVAGT